MIIEVFGYKIAADMFFFYSGIILTILCSYLILSEVHSNNSIISITHIVKYLKTWQSLTYSMGLVMGLLFIIISFMIP